MPYCGTLTTGDPWGGFMWKMAIAVENKEKGPWSWREIVKTGQQGWSGVYFMR